MVSIYKSVKGWLVPRAVSAKAVATYFISNNFAAPKIHLNSVHCTAVKHAVHIRLNLPHSVFFTWATASKWALGYILQPEGASELKIH